MLFLATILDGAVHGKRGEPLGRLEDVIVRIGDDLYPPISGLVVRDRRRLFFVPAAQLESINGVAKLLSSTVNLRPFSRRDGFHTHGVVQRRFEFEFGDEHAKALLTILPAQNGAKRNPLERDPTLPRIVFHEDPALPLAEDEWPEESR